MKIVFMGTPDFSVPVLDALVNAGHEILAVYSQPPRPAGRGKKERPSPVHARAIELGLDVRIPLNFKELSDVSDFKDLNADVAVVVAYGLLLPKSILDAPAQGCLNIHASLLPRWRGAAPIHRAIMAGDDMSGVCIMQMEEGLDTGPVLMREETEILPSDTTAILHDRLSEMGANLIVNTLDNLDNLKGEPQSDEGILYAKKIDKAEAKIDWTKPANEVDRLIRGLSPFPGAWFEVEGTRIKVLMSEALSESGDAGTVLNDDLTIACGEGCVKLHRLQRSGKGAMDAKTFQLGFPLPKGISVLPS